MTARNAAPGLHVRPRVGMAGLLALALSLSAISSAQAAESGTVPGTVTVEQAVACLLVDGSYDFGTQPFSDPAPSTEPHRSDTTASLTNCGQGTQDVLVRGTDAIGDAVPAASWSLSAQAAGPCATDVYGVGVSRPDIANSSSTFASLVDTRFTSLAPAGSFDAAADLYMPCTGSNGAGETMTFSVEYTAVIPEGAPAPTEIEPNDDAASANVLTLDTNGTATAYGAILPVGDHDTYRVTLPGGIVSIETLDGSGNVTCGGIDTVVQLIGPTNSLVAQDDDGGVNACSLVTATIGAPGGTYTIVVTDWNDDTAIETYSLHVRLVDPS